MAVRRVQEGSEDDGDIVFDAHRHAPLQITRWTERRIAATFTSSNQALLIPSGAIVIELTATENCYINFGGSGAVASSAIATDGSRLFLAGVQTIVVPLDTGIVPFTHIAVIQHTVAGILQIEEVQ